MLTVTAQLYIGNKQRFSTATLNREEMPTTSSCSLPRQSWSHLELSAIESLATAQKQATLNFQLTRPRNYRLKERKPLQRNLN